jgi:hypothetical protein
MSDLEPGQQEIPDNDIAGMLRVAGARTLPPADVQQAVRSAVLAEWQLVARERRRRRYRLIGRSLATSVVWAVGGIVLVTGPLRSTGEVIASASRVEGAVSISNGWWQRWHPVQPGQTLHGGQQLLTDHSGRAALTWVAGASLRLDHDTQLVLIDAARATLTRGAVYFDSGSSEPSPHQRLEMRTPAGSVRHLGTQYEVRVLAGEGGVELAVREGRIELATAAGARQWASAGQMLTVVGGKVTGRTAIRPDDPRWEWVMSATPQFNIDGRGLYQFLQWASRELGERLVFVTPTTETEARRVVLSGSVAGLQPVEALTAVLSTTRLRGVRRDGSLVISFPDESGH